MWLAGMLNYKLMRTKKTTPNVSFEFRFSPSLPILMSDDTPLKSGPLSNEELSWLGSINNLGALCGILTFGFITSFLGCKRSMLFLAFPSAAFWLLIYFGNTYYHILFARFFTGWTGGGINTTTLLYISEIVNDKWVICEWKIENS